MKNQLRSAASWIAAVVLFVTLAGGVDGADFNVRVLALSGEAAPGSGSFTLMNQITTNKHGDLSLQRIQRQVRDCLQLTSLVRAYYPKP